MSSTRDVLINILTKGDARGAEEISSSLDRMAEKATATGKALSLRVTAPLAAIAGLAVRAYGVQEQAERRLETALQSTGQEVDSNSEKLKNLASELQKITTFGDETTIQAMSLATQLGTTAEEMEATIKGAMGLASVYGMDLDQATRMAVMAQNGQYEALTRYIPALRDATTEAEKHAAVQDAMRNGFEQAKSDSDTLSGSLQDMSNATGDLLEVIGEALAPTIISIAGAIKTAAEAAQDLDPRLLKLGVGAGALAAALGPVLWATGSFYTSVKVLNTAILTATGSKTALTAATHRHTAATIKNTGAQNANNAAKVTGTKAGFGLAGALTRVGAVGAAAFVGWEIGKRIDEAAGLSDKLSELWIKLREQADLSEPLTATLFKLREQAMAMETLEEKHALRAKILQAQEAATASMLQAQDNGEMEIAQQYADQHTSLGRILSSLDQLLAANQERVAGTHEAADAEDEVFRMLTDQEKIKRLINSLDEDGLATRQQILEELSREKALLDAKISGDEAAITAAEDAIAIERKKQSLLRSGVVEEAEAERTARSLIALQNQAAAAEKKRREEARNAPDGNDDLRTRLGLLDQVDQKEQQTKQLREGVRAEQIQDLSGRTQTRYREGGRIIDESEAFAGAGATASVPSPAAQQPAQPAAQQPAADLAPVTQALANVNLDTAPLTAAIAAMQARLQAQLNDIASQIVENGN